MTFKNILQIYAKYQYKKKNNNKIYILFKTFGLHVYQFFYAKFNGSLTV